MQEVKELSLGKTWGNRQRGGEEILHVAGCASERNLNSALGLEGIIWPRLLLNRKDIGITGLLQAMLMCNGYLTAVRTVAAGAVAAKYMAPGRVETVGVLGTGGQARL